MDKFLGRLIVCRLKAVDSVLSGVESMKQVVADFEIALVSQDTMTSDPSSLYQLREELQVIRRLKAYSLYSSISKSIYLYLLNEINIIL